MQSLSAQHMPGRQCSVSSSNKVQQTINLKIVQKYIVSGYNSHKYVKPRDKEYAFFSSSCGLIFEIFLPQLPKIPSSLNHVLWEIR